MKDKFWDDMTEREQWDVFLLYMFTHDPDVLPPRKIDCIIDD